jgi:hypothetical protein
MIGAETKVSLKHTHPFAAPQPDLNLDQDPSTLATKVAQGSTASKKRLNTKHHHLYTSR